ncbi:MAG: hypothetical protein LKJ80_06665 [Oscillibacter sp.]|jgi:hypothetical protein|nr:hypothetical protein [Oscillibacter sp.]
MKSDSHATKWLMAAVCLAVLAYFGMQTLRYFHDPMATAVVYSYQAENSSSVAGWVVRDEQVVDGKSGGLLRLSRTEGEKVSRGGEIARIYADQASLDRQTDIDGLRTQLSQLQYAQTASDSGEETLKLDQRITDGILALRGDIASDRLDAADSQVRELRALVLKRDYTYSGDGDLDARIKELQKELQTLRSKAASSVRTVTAPESGVYSAVTDGYEAVLTPDFLKTVTPSSLAAVTADPSAQSDLGKLIRGETWYYAASMAASEAAKLTVGQTLTLRFARGETRTLQVRLTSLSDEEKGRVAAVFSCRQYLSEVTMLRRQSADIIWDTVSGLRLPADALRVDSDGQAGVYCVVGVTARFKPVKVVYTGDGYVLVRPAGQEKNPIRSGDQVIITSQKLYDGKVVG